MEHHIPFPSSYKPMLSPGKRDKRSHHSPYTLKERASFVLEGIKSVGKTLYGYATDTYLKCRQRKTEDIGSHSVNRNLINSPYYNDPIQSNSKERSQSNKRIATNINSCTVKMQGPNNKEYQSSVIEDRVSTKKQCTNYSPIVSYKSKETETPNFKSQPPIEQEMRVPKKSLTNEKKSLPIKNEFFRSLDRSVFENVSY